MASLPQSVSYTSETSILTNQIKLSASSQQVFITNIKRIQSIDFVFIFWNVDQSTMIKQLENRKSKKFHNCLNQIKANIFIIWMILTQLNLSL